MQQAQRQPQSRKFQVDDFDEKAIFLCQFCGGAGCDQENYLKNKIQPNAIEGLHSNWITSDILAMQRPSQRLIKQFSLYDRFKEHNIRTVLNLQEPGEHPYCGDGIFPTGGFSYHPQHFYAHGIRCFNESWEDMTATTFEHMMKIMNLFDLTISQGGRISVHCHAGRGRTLLVICSWLIYHDRMTAADTIALAVAKRQGVLTRSSQREFLAYFQQELRQRWRCFGVTSHLHTFTEFVDWQTAALLNKHKKLLHKMPYLHFKLTTVLRHSIPKNAARVVQSLLSPNSPLFEKKWGEVQEKQIASLKDQVNKINMMGVEAQEDPRIISQLLFDFYDQLPYTLVTGLTIECLKDLLKKQQNRPRLSLLLEPAVVHDLGVSGLAVVLDLCHLVSVLSDSLAPQEGQKSKVDQAIEQALFVRLSILFLSKKKYFPNLFSVPPSRQCKIYKYISKIGKAVNPQVMFLASLLQQVGRELPRELQEVQRIIFKACKVDSNLYYLTQQSPQLLSSQKRQEIYDNARIKMP